MALDTDTLTRVASLAELEAQGRLVVSGPDGPVALFLVDGRVHALDNRCPHMGFPLHRGSVEDGILTCHWHHARFDLHSGGTFDLFADNARVYQVEVCDGDIYLHPRPRGVARERALRRLRDGLEHDIGLVIAKAVIALSGAEGDSGAPFALGLAFGTGCRAAGWGQGLTMHAALMNLLPRLDPADRPLALYHGLSAVARDCAGQPRRTPTGALPGGEASPATLKRWFRRFVEVRDADRAERCIASAVRAGANPAQLADMLFAAATDHRYIQIGHVLDFTNKALEALDATGWRDAEPALTSLARAYAGAARMEESNSWRNPVDLVAQLERAFAELPEALHGAGRRGDASGPRSELTELLLSDDPGAIIAGMLGALRGGMSSEALVGAVAYAAALRIARFPTTNEFGDWDTALHTFTFANAVHQGMRRSPSPELLRGAFDAAMSVYLDRFLNVPAVRLPRPRPDAEADPEALLARLPGLLDRRQQVDEAGELIAAALSAGAEPSRVLAALGAALLREDRDFHTIQMVEAAFRQYERLWGTEEGAHVLVAAARYLAAHAATPRAGLQTYTIASRLHRGERLYEDADG
jgi:nitrite reductase/ring-hydroxylating ferredoxin subunit